MEMIEAIVTVPICLKVGMLDRIEKERGNQSRSSYVRDIISTYFLAVDDTEEDCENEVRV